MLGVSCPRIIFHATNTLIINNSLEPIEIKIVGVLWDVYPLPRGQLYLKDDKESDKLVDVFTMFKNKKAYFENSTHVSKNQ
jgi:hypothetical protein